MGLHLQCWRASQWAVSGPSQVVWSDLYLFRKRPASGWATWHCVSCMELTTWVSLSQGLFSTPKGKRHSVFGPSLSFPLLPIPTAKTGRPPPSCVLGAVPTLCRLRACGCTLPGTVLVDTGQDQMVMGNCSMMLEPVLVYNIRLAFESGMLPLWLKAEFVFVGELLVQSAWNDVAVVLQHMGLLEKDAAGSRSRAPRMTWFSSMLLTRSRPRNRLSSIVSGFLLENNWLPCLPSCRRKPRNELIYMKCDDQRKDMGGYQLFCHVNVSYDFHYVSSFFFFLFCFAEI